MIVRCPKCKVRYRLDDARLQGASARLTCPKCQAVFIVRKDSPASLPGGAAPAGAAARTALLADEPREFRDFVAAALREFEFEVGTTDNGEEALLLASGHRFDLILLNVYLRRMLGINVCERLKLEPATRDTPVLLIGALLRQEEGGLPRGLYGADDFIPTSIARKDLLDKIRRWTMGTPPAAGVVAAGAPAPAPADPADSAPPRELGEIRRLARIMVSDIQMYHPEKFNRSLREGTFFEAFAEELGKGKEILDRRFSHLSQRAQLLAAGIRDTLATLRTSSGRRPAAGE
jgi:predicted Zn finger-like uncharacterized protein